MEYEAVIGLETHFQLKLKSKMWCGYTLEHPRFQSRQLTWRADSVAIAA
jgi:Asp-tRNA(Asn)/Glu-tRNA(Gln) amidotransferase B subunit